MKFKAIFIKIIFIFLLGAYTQCYAAFTLSGGKLMDADLVPTLSVQEHFDYGMQAFEARNWPEAVQQFKIASVNFPSSAYGQEAHYYLGIAYYKLGELDFANTAFTDYLKAKSQPRYFQETMEYKYNIAENFRNGARKRFFGKKQLPKWANGKSLALEIYDEVVASVPCHELAARALYAKGLLLWDAQDYRSSIDCFQMLAKRFPRHELAPECYVLINKVYLDQCRFEFQNPDILAFSQINLSRFQKEFPREERLTEAANDVLKIKEVYASGLYETGRFYERKGKPKASLIYYSNVIRQFPETEVAGLCRQCLKSRGYDVELTSPPTEKPERSQSHDKIGVNFTYHDDATENQKDSNE